MRTLLCILALALLLYSCSIIRCIIEVNVPCNPTRGKLVQQRRRTPTFYRLFKAHFPVLLPIYSSTLPSLL